MLDHPLPFTEQRDIGERIPQWTSWPRGPHEDQTWLVLRQLPTTQKHQKCNNEGKI